MRVFGLLAVAVAALAAVQMVSPAVLAQDAAPADDEGTMIQIGPDNGVGVDVTIDGDRAADRRERRLGRRVVRQNDFDFAPQAVSRYWIGIGGESLSAAVRAQVEIDDDEGLLITAVDPEGPAGKAGVQKYDILLRANGEPLTTLGPLAEEVGKQGEAQGQIALDLLRRGQHVIVHVSPEERPAGAFVPQQRRERLGLFGPEGVFGREGAGMLGEEMLGQGGVGELLQAMPQMATGVSVSVTRQNDGPAKVTVQRGDQTWEFDEGDEDAIDALPDDVRPMIERMLKQQGGVFQPGFEGFGLNAPGFQMQLNGEGLAGRMRELQQRMLELQGQMGGAAADPAVPMIEPQIELDEAPAFNSDQAPKAEVEGPTELEIPATE